MNVYVGIIMFVGFLGLSYLFYRELAKNRMKNKQEELRLLRAYIGGIKNIIDDPTENSKGILITEWMLHKNTLKAVRSLPKKDRKDVEELVLIGFDFAKNLLYSLPMPYFVDDLEYLKEKYSEVKNKTNLL